jgi:hypothetical protein
VQRNWRLVPNKKTTFEVGEALSLVRGLSIRTVVPVRL